MLVLALHSEVDLQLSLLRFFFSTSPDGNTAHIKGLEQFLSQLAHQTCRRVRTVGKFRLVRDGLFFIPDVPDGGFSRFQVVPDAALQ